MSLSVGNVAIDARRAAVEDVERLLQHPEDLQQLQGLLDENAKKLQASKLQLSATVQSQTEAAQYGIELLSSSQKTLAKLRECYKVIDDLCTECSSLIENHEKIQLLSAVHYNLGKTLQDVEHVIALPHEAALAEELLREDTNLLQAYENLAMLEGTSGMVQEAFQASIQTGSKLLQKDSQNLGAYFNKVRETFGKFEERLWSIIRNFLNLGRENPSMLVNAVRVVELQEMVEAASSASSAGQPSPGYKGLPKKNYRRRCEQQISNAIQEMFAPLLQRCSQLAGQGENTDKRTSEVLEYAGEFVAHLADIYDFVAPCFPERYNIFQVIWKEYHEHLAGTLDCIGACSDQLANSDILKVMKWINEYQATCGNLGIEEVQCRFPRGPGRGTASLIDTYCERTHNMLHTWFTNILNSDMASQPKISNGKYWTPGAVDFFRILNEQVGVVEAVSKGEMLLRTGEAAVQIMKEYQEAQQGHLTRDLTIETLCALANNNSRCYNESLEFAEKLEEGVAEDYKERLDIETQCRGFLDLAIASVTALVGHTFSDPPFVELFHKLYWTPSWSSQAVTSSIIATIEDYLQDFRTWLDPTFFKKYAEICMQDTAAHYVAAFLTYTKNITDESIRSMQKDEELLTEFFGTICKPEVVTRSFAPLTDLRNLAGSDSVDDFSLSYISLLESTPGITPVLLEHILTSRTDLTKQDTKEVMDHCRSVYIDRMQTSTTEDQVVPGANKAKTAGVAKDKDAAFRIALIAAKRKATKNRR